MEQQVIVIVGPTCSGKTSLAIDLAKELDTEIISADSRQIFKYLTIGTAKPNQVELSQVKHHFIDFIYPDEDYNVGLYEKDALRIIEQISSLNKIPIMVGGSGLYIKAVIDGIVDIDSDEELREKLLSQKADLGNEYLYEQLKKLDPNAATSMLPQNWKRVIRAIEVFALTGKSILEVHIEQDKNRNYNFLQFGLNWPREILYKNIETRVDQMIENGLVEEVKSILEMNYSKKLNSLNTVGYKEIIGYLDNEISLDRAIELIKRNTRRYAKRQLTWFRKDERIKWFDLESFEEIEIIKNKILKSIT